MNILLKKKGKIFAIFAAFIIFVSTSKLYASSISISAPSNIDVGNSTNIAITGSDATGKINVSSSNSGVVSLSTSSVWVENGSVTITATGKSAGTATITLTPSDVANSNGDDITSSLGSKTATIKVIAPTTTNTNTSTNTNTATANKSSNANLKKLVPAVEGLTPNFNSSVTRYSLTVPTTMTNLGITAAVEDSSAKYSIAGNNNLKDGDNTVTVTVTAANGTKKVYTIIVTKVADPAKANAYLSNIIIDGKELKPVFAAETLEYNIDTVASDVKSLTVLAYAQSDKAKVEITGNDNLKDGENIIKIKVTAEDGTTTKEYTIKVNKEAGTVTASTDSETTDALSTINSNGKSNTSFFDKLKMVVKQNLLDILLLLLVIIEFIQLVYMYSKLNKDKIHAFIAKIKGKNLEEESKELKPVDISLDEDKKESEELDYKPLTDSDENVDKDNQDLEENPNEEYADGKDLDIGYTFNSFKTLDQQDEEKSENYNNINQNQEISEEESIENVDDNINEKEKSEEDKTKFKRRSGFDRKR